MDTRRFAMNYGAILGLCLVTLAIVFLAVGIDDRQSIIPALLKSVLTIAFITYAIMQYRDINNNGFISYGASLKLGTTVAFFASVIFAFYFIIYISYIDTNWISDTLNELKDDILNNDNEISEELLDEQLEDATNYLKPHWLMMSYTLMGTFAGFLYSLIISIFVKKEDPNLIA